MKALTELHHEIVEIYGYGLASSSTAACSLSLSQGSRSVAH